MAVAERMNATKGAILSLLTDAYQRRDRVGLIVFQKDRATLVLPPTNSVQLAHLPVAGLRLHYGQASIITPSDFHFARDGIAAEGGINEEQIVVADVDLALLHENRLKGTTIPLLDKRHEFYGNRPVIVVAD